MLCVFFLAIFVAFGKLVFFFVFFTFYYMSIITVYTTRDGCECAVVMRSVASVCVCVYPVHALTFKSLDLETSFSVCRYNFGMLWSKSSTKVFGSRSQRQKSKTSVAKYTYLRVVSTVCLVPLLR